MLRDPTDRGRDVPVSAALAPQVLDPRELLAPLTLAGQKGEIPDAALTAQIASQADRVTVLTPVEVYEQLTPGLCGHHPEVAMQWLRDAGLLIHLLPELDATVALSQEGGRRHKDVWEHTKAVVRQAVPRPAVRWAAVLHDIGKVTTRRFVGPGKVTFHGHAEEGVRMFRRGPAKRVGFPAPLRERVEVLILYHLRGGQYDGGWTDAAVRRFAHEMGPALTDVLDLSRADVTSKRPGKRKKCLGLISELSRRIRGLAELDARVPPLPAGLGNLLMEALALPPGKHIGELRARLERMCEDGSIDARQEPDYYVEVVRSRGLLAGLNIAPPQPRRASA
jgi:poly(A) polymerase